MKAEYLSPHDKEIAAKYPDAVFAEFGIKCSFCLSLLPRPKWYQRKEGERNSTGYIINNLKARIYFPKHYPPKYV